MRTEIPSIAKVYPILVIAKNDESKATAHFFMLATDESDAIRMTKEHLSSAGPEGPATDVSGTSPAVFASYGGFNQFTVKRVWPSNSVSEFYVL